MLESYGDEEGSCYFSLYCDRFTAVWLACILYQSASVVNDCVFVWVVQYYFSRFRLQS